MFLDLQTPAYAQNLVFDAAMRFWMIVLLVPMSLMKSPKYLHVVAFVPPVSLPSALDCFAATSAPVPIHTGTTTSLESAISHPIEDKAGTNVLVFSLICFPELSSASSPPLAVFSSIVSSAMSSTKVRRVGSICRRIVLFDAVCAVLFLTPQ